MRNRFKPTLSNSRASRRSGSSTLSNANAGENVSSGSAANTTIQETVPKANEESESSETVPKTSATTEQKQDKTSQLKTPSTPSASTAGLSRRSRIKPAVIPVAHTPRNSRNKDKTTVESRNASADEKESNSLVLQGHKTSRNKDNQVLSHEEQGQEDSSTEDVSKLPSLKERNQQVKSRCSVVTSPPVTNTEQRSHPVATQDPIIKPSQSQNKNTNYDSTVPQTNESGAPSSFPRRKRVLPNLGSASRRRHSSVSKENVEKNTDLPEIIHEEVVTTGKDLEHANEQSPVECSTSRNKRLRSFSEEENTADHGQLPAAASDVHDKEHEEEEEEEGGNKRKGVKRKRGGRPRKLKEPSDPSQMTMQHLIYFNPKTNPMTSSLAGKKKKPERKIKRKKGKDKNLQETESVEETNDVNNPSSVSESPAKTDPPENSKNASIDEGDADNSDAVAPRVKLDAEGNIIVDEESLLIPKSPEKALDDSEIVYEDADEVNCGTYLRHRKVERWSLKETQKFYKALSQVGTDFSLMGPLFPSRIRRELKAKFKREEKLHRSLVEKALRVRNPIEVELFTPKVDGEEIDDDLASTENNSSTQLTLDTEEQ